MPFFSLSPRWETGERRGVAGSGPHRRPAPRGRPGGRGKERGRLKGLIPPLGFGEGGPQGGDSWRRAAAGGGGHGGAAVGLAGGQGEEGE